MLAYVNSIVRHLTAVLFGALTSLILTPLLGLGVPLELLERWLAVTEEFLAAVIMLGAYAAYEKLLKPFFARFAGGAEPA
jgi:predicted Na+-dependent transporter